MSIDALPTAHRLLALLFTDVVGSTQLKATLGMPAYSLMLRRHNELVEVGMREIGASAPVIKHTGDGYFAAFETPSDAVRFALVFQSRMRLEPWGSGPALITRVGIHLGQVELIEQAGRSDIVGLAADLAARLMSLAGGGQILLTRQAFDDARQYVRDNPADRRPGTLADADVAGPPLRWLAHGPFLFKGAPEPMEVFEVGIEGVNPLSSPPDGEKARRIVRHDEEPVLGWRPSVGDHIPNRTNFVLCRKIGEGGFGEVWLAKHGKLKDERVFKFCFNAERLRSLKREYVLFRLIQETLGEREDIAKLYDYNLDAPPFYLESEHTAGGNLQDWADRRGGIDTVPLDGRLTLFAQIAVAVGAAHSVGILHKDIKPSNILIHELKDGTIQPRLSDFGIGFIADRTQLELHHITETGFTQITEMASGGTSRTGTRLYAAPEAAMNRPFTTQGDVFALGVLLYQLVIGDLERPLTAEWRDDVDDELIREDIAAATSRDPTARVSANAIADRVLNLTDRRAERERQRQEREALLLIQQQRAEAERARVEAQRQADVANEVVGFLTGMFQAAAPKMAQGRVVTAVEVVERGVKDLAGRLDGQDPVKAAIEVALGNVLHSLGRASEAEPLFRDALERRRRALGNDHPNTVESLTTVAWAIESLGRAKDAEPFYKEAMERSPAVRGEDHPDTITAINNYGGVLYALGRTREAVRLLRKGVYRLKRALGEDHVDVLIAFGNYAVVLWRMGKGRAVEPLHKDTLERARRVLGPDHPEAMRLLSGYAVLLQTLGRSDEAAALHAEGLDRKRRILGNDHPETHTSIHAYANTLSSLGRVREAQPLFEEVVERRRRILGEDHPATIRSMIAYSSALRLLGRLSEAEQVSKDALDRSRRVLGEDHPDTITAISHHTNALDELGKWAECEALYRDVYDRRRRVLGDEHHDTFASLSRYANVLTLLGRAQDAEPLAKDAYINAPASLGPDHPNAIRSIEVYANVLHAIGQLDEAELLARGALERRARVSGPDHPETILAVSNYAALLRSLGRVGDALSASRVAVERANRHPSLGPEHPSTRRYAESAAAMSGSMSGEANSAPAISAFVARLIAGD